MFKIVQNPSYMWPVTVELPADGGKTEKATFDAEFKRLTQTRITEIGQSLERGELNDSGLAREVMVGWSGVIDENGPVPFSSGALDKLLDVPGLATAVALAYLGSITGAKRKN